MWLRNRRLCAALYQSGLWRKLHFNFITIPGQKRLPFRNRTADCPKLPNRFVDRETNSYARLKRGYLKSKHESSSLHFSRRASWALERRSAIEPYGSSQEAVQVHAPVWVPRIA